MVAYLIPPLKGGRGDVIPRYGLYSNAYVHIPLPPSKGELGSALFISSNEKLSGGIDSNVQPPISKHQELLIEVC
jgi:hypothetical protein